MKMNSKNQWSYWMKLIRTQKIIQTSDGYSTQQKNSAKTKQSTMQWSNQYQSSTAPKLTKIKDTFLIYCLVPSLLVLILMLGMTIWMTLMIGLIFIIGLKSVFHLTSIILTGLQKVVYRRRH